MTVRRSALDRWIFEEFKTTASNLAVGRIVLAASVLLLVYPRYLWMAEVPASFWAPPPGLGIFFRQQPSAWVLRALVGAMVTANVALLVGWRARAAGLILAGLTLIANTFDYGFGKIDHDILLTVTLVLMSFSGWEQVFSFDGSRRVFEDPPQGWPLALLAFATGLAMLTAALPKASTGWLDLGTQSIRGYLLLYEYGTDRATTLGALALRHTPTAIWEFMDWATVLLEASCVVAAFSRRGFRFWCALAVVFHTGIHFMMSIFFLGNLAAYAMFVEWDVVTRHGAARRLMGAVGWVTARSGGLAVVAASVVLSAVYVTVGNPVARVLDRFGDGAFLRDTTAMLAALAVSATYFTWLTRRLWVTGRARRAPSMPAVILFDGVCGLCNRWVDFVLARDRHGAFRFAALQTPWARDALGRHGVSADALESIVLIDGDQMAFRSAAALGILRRLGGPWRVAYALILVPTPIRDAVYDIVATYRYRWFGKRDICRVPTLENRARFLG